MRNFANILDLCLVLETEVVLLGLFEMGNYCSTKTGI